MLGLDTFDEVDKMRHLSSLRVEEIKICAKSTYCIRQKWISDDSPTMTDILKKYPKFGTVPELVCGIKSIKKYTSGIALITQPGE